MNMVAEVELLFYPANDKKNSQSWFVKKAYEVITRESMGKEEQKRVQLYYLILNNIFQYGCYSCQGLDLLLHFTHMG